MTRLEASKRVVVAESIYLQAPTEKNKEAVAEARKVYEAAITKDRKKRGIV